MLIDNVKYNTVRIFDEDNIYVCYFSTRLYCQRAKLVVLCLSLISEGRSSQKEILMHKGKIADHFTGVK
jgi:hypothetical protein